MTKLWCTLCRKYDFEPHPPKPEHIVKHLREVHYLPVSVDIPEDLQLWRQHQDIRWQERREALNSKINELELDEYDPDCRIVADLKAQLERHINVCDNEANTTVTEAIGEGSATADQGRDYSPEAVEAAKILMAMQQSKPAEGIKQQQSKPSERYKEHSDAAIALQMLKDGEGPGDVATTLSETSVTERSRRSPSK